jgi:hypothetical protein
MHAFQRTGRQIEIKCLMNKNKLSSKNVRTKALNHVLTRIGQGLGKLRARKGYANIKDFAAAYDLPLVQYWRIEKGKANLTLKSLVKLLAIHQLAVEDFFCMLSELTK